MFILGLTGSIGMGKSATAAMFRARGIAVHDADAAVHALYRNAAVAPVEAAFPGVIRDGAIDRTELGKRVLSDAAAMKKLEAIVHPLVRAEEEKFLAQARAHNAGLVVLDVPLLLEGKMQNRCDAIVVVSASPDIQRQRVLARDGMTGEKFNAILKRQMPDTEKRRCAHFIIDTGLGFASAEKAVGDIARALAGRAGRVRERGLQR